MDSGTEEADVPPTSQLEALPEPATALPTKGTPGPALNTTGAEQMHVSARPERRRASVTSGRSVTPSGSPRIQTPQPPATTASAKPPVAAAVAAAAAAAVLGGLLLIFGLRRKSQPSKARSSQKPAAGGQQRSLPAAIGSPAKRSTTARAPAKLTSLNRPRPLRASSLVGGCMPTPKQLALLDHA
jgi:hypothetical protein